MLLGTAKLNLNIREILTLAISFERSISLLGPGHFQNSANWRKIDHVVYGEVWGKGI
jgi:hypothetical protein